MVSHEQFKELTANAKVIIRTGETTPYANVILQSGVIFKKRRWTSMIQMSGISKAFSGNVVLNNVEFELHEGEIHALMGENGAGKSTLMKILSGIYEKDAGVVKVDGKQVDFKSPKDSEEMGIAVIHQELNILPDLTVAENLFLGKEKHMVYSVFCGKRKCRRRRKSF